MLAGLAGGVTDPRELSEMAKGKLRGKRGALKRAFRGSFREEDASLLQVELQVIADLEAQLEQLEALIEQKVGSFEDVIALLDTIPGVNRVTAIDLIAEIGTDMTAWKTDRQFAAWSGTCPGNRESAGVRKKAKAREGNPYVKTILIQAAVSASQTIGSHLAHRFHRLSARRGPRRAFVAVAREIAVAVYHMISQKVPYTPPRNVDPEVTRQQRSRHLMRELTKLGYEVNCKLLNTEPLSRAAPNGRQNHPFERLLEPYRIPLSPHPP
jgi:hypothetical protein